MEQNFLMLKAYNIALVAHAGQTRKYSGLPYIVHSVSVWAASQRHLMNPTAQAAALLHDVLEDAPQVSLDDYANWISKDCGSGVLSLVHELTKPSKFPEHKNKKRAVREEIDLSHYANMSVAAKELKALDRIDNLASLLNDCNDEQWMAKYFIESQNLEAVIQSGILNHRIRRELNEMLTIFEYQTKLKFRKT